MVSLHDQGVHHAIERACGAASQPAQHVSSKPLGKPQSTLIVAAGPGKAMQPHWRRFRGGCDGARAGGYSLPPRRRQKKKKKKKNDGNN